MLFFSLSAFCYFMFTLVTKLYKHNDCCCFFLFQHSVTLFSLWLQNYISTMIAVVFFSFSILLLYFQFGVTKLYKHNDCCCFFSSSILLFYFQFGATKYISTMIVVFSSIILLILYHYVVIYFPLPQYSFTVCKLHILFL